MELENIIIPICALDPSCVIKHHTGRKQNMKHSDFGDPDSRLLVLEDFNIMNSMMTIIHEGNWYYYE